MSAIQIISPAQLAQIFSFSKKSIYVLCIRGSSSLPPSLHVGTDFRWHPAVDQTWIDQQVGAIPSEHSLAFSGSPRFPGRNPSHLADYLALTAFNALAYALSGHS